MKFEIFGDTYDTDKPIYVLGYTIGNTYKYWFPLQKENLSRVLEDSYYNISCRQMYVKEITYEFDRSSKRNEVIGLKLYSLNSGVTISYNYNTRHLCIIGHSVSDCKQKLKEWRNSI